MKNCIHSYRRLITPLLFLFLVKSGISASTDNQFGFIENKGQYTDRDNHEDQSVLYVLQTSDIRILVRGNGFSYQFEQPPLGSVSGLYTTHRIDFNFGNSFQCPVLAQQSFSDIINYIGNGHKEIYGVHHYKKLLYANAFPNIDIELSFVDVNGVRKFEYNCILHPGAQLADIDFQIIGADWFVAEDGNRLSLKTGTISINESIPQSWISDANGKHEPVKIIYKKDGEHLHFIDDSKFTLNAGETLVVDPTPTLDWGTYLGGSQDDECKGMCIDASGNAIVCGIAASTTSIASVGAHQTTKGGSDDAFVAKFSNAGVRLWSTYYGGSNIDEAYDVQVDASGNIYLCGKTLSSAGIASSGAYQTAVSGTDAFLAKFNSSGVRQWGTYYGGSGTESAAALVIDGSGNIIIAGSTTSSTGIATSGAFKTTVSGTDAFIASFSSAGGLQFATYFGGTGIEATYSIDTDPSGEIYVVGTTGSSSGIATSGSHQSILASSTDGFIARFNNSLSTLQWATYYGGTGFDFCYGVHCSSTDVYVGGYTASATDIATSGAYQTILSGFNDAFLVKFDFSGVRQWGTYYGGPAAEIGFDIDIDDNGQVLFTGLSSSSTNIASASAWQTTHGGGDDVFIASFSVTGGFNWGSYYGASGAERALEVTHFAPDQIFICGQTNSTSSISTPGAHQTTYNGLSGADNAFVARFYENVVLPIDLLYFDAKVDALSPSVVNCDWVTLTEINNSHFEIQHSTDGVQYTVLDTITGAGNSSTMRSYAYIHRQPKKGVNYYRLRQVDFNGSFSYSNIDAVDLVTDERIQIIQNPVQDYLTFSATGYNNPFIDVTIFSSDGKELHTMRVATENASARVSIPIMFYNPGKYLLRVSGAPNEIMSVIFIR